MTAVIARQPLLPLSMSAMQRPPRRLSARLRDKEDFEPVDRNKSRDGDALQNAEGAAQRGKAQHDPAGQINNKKRKLGYDEDDQGFSFARVKKRKPRVSTTPAAPIEQIQSIQTVQTNGQPPADNKEDGAAKAETIKKPRNKMSFSTPKAVADNMTTRRSKRLSSEKDEGGGSPKEFQRRPQKQPVPPPKTTITQIALEKTPAVEKDDTTDDHSATKIALPFADTPVIRRNKAMREGKTGGKGERRSSLGLRGRRASSLIESGNSNALPHSEVEIPDFYKHIESESLPEPKRMRQLLTWCATRAMGVKPQGSDFEDLSIKQAARVVQKELLNEISNRSEMSDWFGREDLPMEPQIPLQVRPHPKNVQNESKIVELEEQIKRLRTEKEALESLLQPPPIEPLPEPPIDDKQQLNELDPSLLSDADRQIWTSLQPTTHPTITTSRITKNPNSTTAPIQNSTVDNSTTPAALSQRLTALLSTLQPSLDTFADSVHKLSQYNLAADRLASRALEICARKLAEREREGRRRNDENGDSHGKGDRKEEVDLETRIRSSPKRDVAGVLRGIARAEMR